MRAETFSLIVAYIVMLISYKLKIICFIGRFVPTNIFMNQFENLKMIHLFNLFFFKYHEYFEITLKDLS